MLIGFWFFRCVGFRFRCQNNTEKSAVALYILVFNSVYKGEKSVAGTLFQQKRAVTVNLRREKRTPSDNADASPRGWRTAVQMLFQASAI